MRFLRSLNDQRQHSGIVIQMLSRTAFKNANEVLSRFADKGTPCRMRCRLGKLTLFYFGK